MNRKINISSFPEISVFSDSSNFEFTITKISEESGLFLFRFTMQGKFKEIPPEVSLFWKIPYINMKGVWKYGSLHDKRQQYDWELNHIKSRISVDAPIISVFGHKDENRITFALSDALNMVEMNALLREEDNCQYCFCTLFKERHPEIDYYETDLLIDIREIPFYKAIENVSNWWSSFPAMKPTFVPPLAKVPLYSTWYNFHQDLVADKLIEECRSAVKNGYELVIVDDGWQTNDSNRGYDYTGDWEPDRFPDMKDFVAQIKATGIKFGLWFSVPFCGKKSKAYKRFKGKFLTENHRWAPVFDPRFPDVREHLISIYVKALEDWDVDMLKLDFIDDFKVYPETILSKEGGRDFANVNEAVNELFSEAITALKAIKPNVAIEFRQWYTGPIMRKYGNMFRAFDCPNDPISNRIMTTDLKLVMGESAVHSDMITWHKEEPIEYGAIQIINAIFSVPQMSVFQTELPSSFIRMIKFYMSYWRENRSILLEGEFIPFSPLANYPLLSAKTEKKIIYGLYEPMIIIAEVKPCIDVLNASSSENVVLSLSTDNAYQAKIYDCEGKKSLESRLDCKKELHSFKVPIGGMIQLTK